MQPGAQPPGSRCNARSAGHRGRRSARVLAMHHTQAFTPMLIQLYYGPFDTRRKIAQKGVRCRMDMKSGSDQVEQRRCGREFARGEVGVAAKLAVLLKPAYTRPIV